MLKLYLKLTIQITMIALIASISSCHDSNKQETTDSKEKPGQTARLFAEETIATGMNERDAALSPNGKAFYYTIQLNRKSSTIVCSEKKNGQWSKPEVVSFSGKYNDLEPVFHPDGQKLFFVSNRPLEDGEEIKDYNIWYVERKGNQWSNPVHAGEMLNSPANEFYPSFTSDGTLYFCAHKEGSIGGEDIFYSEYKDGEFQEPKNMGDSINTPSNEYNAFISPDGSFIMYNTHGAGKGFGSGDIYIAFRDSNGIWRKPINMGEKINSEYFEYCPSLSADGKILFFTSQKIHRKKRGTPISYNELKTLHNQPGNGEGDIYFIDAGVIDELKRKVLYK